VNVSDDVISALYDYTKGYPGLWCMCARLIQNVVSETHISKFDINKWETLLSSGAITKTFRGYASTAKILAEFKKDENLKKTLWKLLSSMQPNVKFTMDSTQADTIFLASSGLIVPVLIETGEFILGPPALQACVVLGISKTRISPPVFVPIKNDQLDVLETLKTSLKLMDINHLQNAYDYATKTSEITPITGRSAVLKEAVYSVELISVLRSWFPLDIEIIPEVNCDKKRADILISSESPPFKVVVELLANERYGPESRPSSMLGHITRAKLYADSLGTTAWVIHFIGVEKFPTKSEFPDSPTCCCVYVYHLHNLTKMKISAKITDKTTTEFEI